jgi:hypothetical protein
MQMGLRLAAMAMQVLYAMGKSFHLEALNHWLGSKLQNNEFNRERKGVHDQLYDQSIAKNSGCWRSVQSTIN